MSTVSAENVAAFRLARHHLVKPCHAGLIKAAADVCGVQAQVLSSGEHSLALRTAAATRTAIRNALWKDRTLVRALLQRQTLHLIPAVDFHLYIAALKRSRMGAVLRVMARLGITPARADAITQSIVDELQAGPLTRQELTRRVIAKASGKEKKWMQLVSMVARPAAVQGLVCYGEQRGAETLYVRTEQWLAACKPVSEEDAKAELFTRFFRAYGPATLADMVKWSGMPVPEARAALAAIRDRLTEVAIDGKPAFVLIEDFPQLRASRLKAETLRLLPGFDTYLLAHASKDHLIPTAHYKKVYRSQGWISATVLLNGRIVGTWGAERKGSKLQIQVDPFEKLPRTLHSKLEEQVEWIEKFVGADAVLNMSRK